MIMSMMPSPNQQNIGEIPPIVEFDRSFFENANITMNLTNDEVGIKKEMMDLQNKYSKEENGMDMDSMKKKTEEL